MKLPGLENVLKIEGVGDIADPGDPIDPAMRTIIVEVSQIAALVSPISAGVARAQADIAAAAKSQRKDIV